MKQTFTRQQGATLIEVLIAMVVLAIGLLGLAGLQSTSIQSNQGSYYRSQATVLANDMADRMRANRTAALAGGYAIATAPRSSSSNTVSGTRAEKDKAEWLNALAETLPLGTGKITLNNNIFLIEVIWNDNRARIKASNDATTPTETFAYRTRL